MATFRVPYNCPKSENIIFVLKINLLYLMYVTRAFILCACFDNVGKISLTICLSPKWYGYSCDIFPKLNPAPTLGSPAMGWRLDQSFLKIHKMGNSQCFPSSVVFSQHKCVEFLFFYFKYLQCATRPVSPSADTPQDSRIIFTLGNCHLCHESAGLYHLPLV